MNCIDLSRTTPVTKQGQRAKGRPIVTVADGGCVASAEVRVNAVGARLVYTPSDPCSASMSYGVP